MLFVLFCHPFGAGCYCIYQGLHPWLFPFSPSGLWYFALHEKAVAVGRPFRVAIPGAYSDSCKAEALPYV